MQQLQQESMQLPDWNTNFVSKKTIGSGLQYKEFVGTLEQSPSDLCEYKLIKLSNNLVALCINDQKATAASASLSVNVGMMSDTPQLAGIAHLLEHMLTRGSVKYPDSGSYDEYLAEHDGYNNAYTSLTNTAYYFGVTNNALKGALDRFSSFFTAPLFDKDAVEQEVHAVDSEFQGCLNKDSKRQAELERMLTNSNHPYSQFAVGNHSTLLESAGRLNLNLADEVANHFHAYYSADIMRLVIAGNYSVDQLVEWAVEKFSDIISKGNTKPQYAEHPFTPGVLGKAVHFETLADSYLIDLAFVLPNLKQMYESDPTSYITSLIVCEARGSLYYYLKQAGLALSVDTSVSSHVDGFSLVRVCIEATKYGTDNYLEAVKAVFAYFQMLARVGPQQWYFSEQQVMSKLEFKYKDAADTDDLVLDLTWGIHNEYLKPEHFISRDYTCRWFDANATSKILEFLSPQSCRVFIGAPKHTDIECNNIEVHYGIRYNVSDLPITEIVQSTIEISKFNFSMPRANKHLPKDISLLGTAAKLEDIAQTPTLLKSTDNYELWFKQDDQFMRPMGSIHLQLQYPNDLFSLPEATAMTVLDDCIAYKLAEQLDEYLYAGLNYSVTCNKYYMTVNVYGYNDKLPSLLIEILDILRWFKVNASDSAISANDIRQGMQNEKHEKPYIQLKNQDYYRLMINSFQSHEVINAALDKITPDIMQSMADRFLVTVHSKLLICGNFTEEQAIHTLQNVNQRLEFKTDMANLHTPSAYIDIAPGHYLHSVVNKSLHTTSNAVLIAIFCDLASNKRQKMVVCVLSRLLHTAFYNQLRTEEQLGYTVDVSVHNGSGDRTSLHFIVQGEHNPDYLTMRIDNFLAKFREKLAAFGEVQIQSLIAAMIGDKSQPLNSIHSEAEQFWTCIDDGDYDFLYNVNESACLDEISLPDLLAGWDKYFNKATAAEYRRVDFQMWSSSISCPSENERTMYPEAIVALYGCLEKEGLTCIKHMELSQFVQQHAANGNVSVAISALKERFSIKVPSAKNQEAIFSSDAKVATALEMAIASYQAPANGGSEDPELPNSNMRQTANGKYIINDPDAFKLTSPLHSQVIPVMKLIPKYT